jgi:adenosylcobalamin-dependent ribonucleoside-triphosphate reductase
MHHWTTNISVEIDNAFLDALAHRDRYAVNVFQAVVAGMWANGEPGFTNTEAASVGEYGDVRSSNPCGEIFLEEGESCNIGSVDLDAFGTDDDGAEEAFRLMARFLIRATLVAPYQAITAEVEHRNRRIGVGFLGMQGWAASHGVKYSDVYKSKTLAKKLVRFRKAIRQEADAYCDELKISRCIKVTAIAPNGTISQLRGTQPGLHPVLARYAWRRVRYTFGDPRISEALDRGLMVEPCIYASNTAVVRYPLRDVILDNHPEELIEQASDVSLNDQLAVLAFVTAFFTSGNDGNAVSFTANLDREAIGTVTNAETIIEQWLPHVKGLTVFPAMSRPQSPYEVISRDEYEAAAAGLDYTGTAEIECANGACPIK